MAEGDRIQKMEIAQEQMDDDQLKYLDFVQIAAVRTMILFSNLYDYAKENSGPLKPGVQTVEGTVRMVIGPVYEKLHDMPSEILKFADQKVDGLVHEVERRVPPLVKNASSQAVYAAHKAPGVVRSVASEVQRAGVLVTATELAKAACVRLEPTVKELHARYEPVAEQYAVSAWRSLNRLPLVPEVAHLVVPTAAYCSEKYNEAVCSAAEKGYAVSAYLPLVPTQRIAKVFGGEPK